MVKIQFRVKGKIIDKNIVRFQLESATIYLKSAKDSTLIDYTISDKNGNFAFSNKKNGQSQSILKFHYTSYTMIIQKKLENLKADKDFGIHKTRRKC